MRDRTITVAIESERRVTSDSKLRNANNIQNVQVQAESVKRKPDPDAMRLFWYLFAGSAGGNNRIRIIMHLKERPYNRNQLAQILGLDYKAVQYHLDVLAKNNLITRQGEKYGVMFFISPYLEAKMDAFDEIYDKISKK